MTQNNTFYFLRHGETIKDPLKPALEWSLTTDTLAELEQLSGSTVFADVTAVYTSREDKAIKTALPFAAALNIVPQVFQGLEEVTRGNKFLTDDEFERLKREKLERRDSSADGGETADEALKRFIEAIEQI